MQTLGGSSDPHALVVATLARLQHALGERDVDAAVACFVPTGAIFGASVDEQAHGTHELRAWMSELVERDLDPRWEIEESYARLAGDEIWFVAAARLDVDDGRRGPVSRRFRLSGVLRGGRGFYRFELFNGFEPLVRPDLQVIGG